MAEVRKVVTIVFCDIVGSTRLGERLDPETLRVVTSRYFDAMRVALERHGGSVEKFIGDAVMAVFGLPTLHEDDALRAVRAALDMRSGLAELNAELERDHAVRIDTRTGISTGEVISGDGANAQRLATGDAVNVAARLEQAAGAGEILIGEATYELVSQSVRTEGPEALELSGKAESVRAWRVRGVLAEPASVAEARFVGRDRELALLFEAFARSRDEEACRLVTVAGPPGIGKSRLVHELTAGLDAAARVAVGRCLAYGEAITYAPMVEIVNQLTDARELVADAQDGAAVWDRISAAHGTSAHRVSPEEIAWAFRKLLEAAAREQPLVVVVDDIHWAEPVLLDLLEYIVAFAGGVPILLVCLARPDLFESRPWWATPRPNANVLALEPLTEAETRNLIELLGRTTRSDASERIVAAAEGNPLFVEQMVALQEESASGEPVVPANIQALLAARIDRLPVEERNVLMRASIEGRRFHRGAVAELLPDDERPQLGPALLSLVRKELLRPDQALFESEDGFRFSHVLIRDAAYGATPKQLRAELHERHGHWLERHPGEHAEIVGFHLEQAWRYREELGAPPDETVALAQAAGRKLWDAARVATLRMDASAAAALYERATTLLPEEPTGELLQEFGAALNRAGGLTGAPVIQRAIERARQSGNRRTELHARLDRLWVPQGQETRRKNAELRLEAQALVPELEGFDDHLGLTKAWQLVAMSDWGEGLNGRSEAALAHALEHARVVGDHLEESEVRMALLGASYYGEASVDEGLRLCEREMEAAPGDWLVEACALAYSAGLTAMRGGFEGGRAMIERSVALCDEFNVHSIYPLFQRFDVEMLAGSFAEAETWLREGQKDISAMEEWYGVELVVRASLAVALCELGRYDEVEQQTLDVPRDTDGLLSGHILWRRARARALARLGGAEESLRLADEAVAIAERTDSLNLRADALLDRAEVSRLLGRGDDADQDVDAAAALYTRKGNLVMTETIRRRR